MIALFFALRIIGGKNTLEELPGTLQSSVKEVLLDKGFTELAQN